MYFVFEKFYGLDYLELVVDLELFDLFIFIIWIPYWDQYRSLEVRFAHYDKIRAVIIESCHIVALSYAVKLD